MVDVYIYLLCIAVPLLLIATNWRDRISPMMDRVFARIDLPSRRSDYDR